MHKEFIAVFFWAFVATIYIAGLSTKANAGEAGPAGQAPPAAVVTTETPTAGNDTGGGRDALRQAPGYGPAGPANRGRYSSSPPYPRDYRGAVPSGPRYGRPGYGPSRRGYGYGYGYPGYRGQGGSGYPRHRQYANPPRYPAATPPGDGQIAPQQ